MFSKNQRTIGGDFIHNGLVIHWAVTYGKRMRALRTKDMVIKAIDANGCEMEVPEGCIAAAFDEAYRKLNNIKDREG